MMKQLKIQSIEMVQEGLKYGSHPERKRAMEEEGGGSMEGNRVMFSWKQRCHVVQLAMNTCSTSCAEVATVVTSLK